MCSRQRVMIAVSIRFRHGGWGEGGVVGCRWRRCRWWVGKGWRRTGGRWWWRAVSHVAVGAAEGSVSGGTGQSAAVAGASSGSGERLQLRPGVAKMWRCGTQIPHRATYRTVDQPIMPAVIGWMSMGSVGRVVVTYVAAHKPGCREVVGPLLPG